MQHKKTKLVKKIIIRSPEKATTINSTDIRHREILRKEKNTSIYT